MPLYINLIIHKYYPTQIFQLTTNDIKCRYLRWCWSIRLCQVRVSIHNYIIIVIFNLMITVDNNIKYLNICYLRSERYANDNRLNYSNLAFEIR